jgi:hypothetical protein
VDVPLQEEAEAYQVGYGTVANPVSLWNTTGDSLIIPASDMADLRTALIGGAFWVRQIGKHALSDALHLMNLN